jgi:hypothetical protein
MISFNEYLSEGKTSVKKSSNILKQTEVNGMLISTAKIPGTTEFETMVFKKYSNPANGWDYDGIYEARTKTKFDALLTHHMVEYMVKSGEIK